MVKFFSFLMSSQEQSANFDFVLSVKRKAGQLGGGGVQKCVGSNMLGWGDKNQRGSRALQA